MSSLGTPDAHASPPSLKVLIVDDEPGFRQLLQWELKNRGFDVQTAENGMVAVQLAAENRYDVIVTDITMPVMNGLELLEEIKKRAPETQIIVTTGFGAVETAVHAMQSGARDFLLKPFDIEGLVKRVKEATSPSSRCRTCGRSVHE
jgi:two-component system, NtrC family, sensor kinase